MQEHAARKERRHHLIFYLKVFDQHSGEQIGYLGDIATEGLMVMSQEPLEVGRHYDLEVRTVEGLADARVLRFSGESRWCHTDINPDFYATGFRLTEAAEETEAAIRRLIKEIGFPDA